MSDKPTADTLQKQLDAAQETIKALSKRMRQLESNASQLPFQKQLQSYQQRIAEKSKALEKAENWFELIVQNAMDAIIRLDHDGYIKSWNPMAEQMFGFSEQEVIDQRLEDILIPKHLHATSLNYFHRHLARGRGALMNQRVEGLAQCKDGTELPVEFVGSVVQQGDTLAYAMVLRDISERKAAEQALRKSHADLEDLVEARTGEVRDLASIIEATLNFVGIADLQGHVLYINPAGRNMTGLDQEQAVDDMTVDAFHSPETYQLLQERIFPQTIKQGVYESACEFIDQQSNSIPAACTFMSLPDTHGNPNRLAVIARDLRREIALQQQMEHVDRLESMGVLAGGIAHDFNNILTAIIGNTGIAKRKIDTYSPGQEYLQRIEQSSLQAANLCKQMLAYSGKGDFIIKPVNLSTLVEEMHSLLEVSIDKSVILKCDLSTTLPMVDADITQIQQVLMNLVINASEAMLKQSGVIVVATGIMQVDELCLNSSIHKPDISTGRFVYLEVSDSGCGMDADTKKKIFDPFFTTKFTGRGLGMSAVLGIVHGHHGLLKLYSEPDKGTTFKIALPITESPKQSEPTSKAQIVSSSGLILVIDDEETIRELASMILEEMGFEVITAVDGRDGVACFRQHQHRITGVLLDMTMPHMNGEECYNALHNIKPDIRVILSSGYSAEDATARFKGKGLTGFIQKPYLIDHFQEVVSNCFNSTS
ncbi:PAS domain S-box protein [Mariprofundus sp. EBB-1]|uniref:PAS domain-containing hybrid sensor histidine kinase/response regulator n=1 Tax=Mariprofundus sp. EBB-1 TaxID=2650971 RepID=UPI00137AE9D5|nr:PAS domain S-box protein [Mariprofundus sp. EBB-1]